MSSARTVVAVFFVLSLLAAGSAYAAVVQGDVACDNFHALYVGNASGTVLTLHGGGNSFSTPTTYNFVCNDSYIYIVAWTDNAVQQGLLHDLTVDGNYAGSDHPGWEVCPSGGDTGNAAYPGGAPTLAQLSLAIAAANVGACWVPVTIGGPNNGTFPTANPWPAVGSIPATTRWTWYESGGIVFLDQPFRPGWDHGEYLIFRLVKGTVPTEASPWGRIKALYN